MKWIKLYAYWNTNLGDDLMVEILLNRYPDYMFYSEDSNISNQFWRISNFRNRGFYYKKYGKLNRIFNIITHYRYKDMLLKKIFRKIDGKCICSVYIGGSLYMQDMDSEEWLEERVTCEEKKLCTPPLYIVGANFGPIRTKQFISIFREYFSKCGGVSFRDKFSYSLFSELPNVQYAPDVVFNLVNEIKENRTSSRVLISVINVRGKESISQYADDYEKFIVSLCYQCVSLSKIPVLVSFCAREGDEKAIENILNDLDQDIRSKVDRLFYTGDNTDIILKEFQSADMIIATRFHAMILSILYKKSFWAISYNEKIKNVLNDMGCNRFCTMDNLNTARMEEIFADSEQINFDEYIKNAKHQFDQLDNYLKYNS